MVVCIAGTYEALGWLPSTASNRHVWWHMAVILALGR